jgi:ABC-2 type transport system permease protein
MAAFLTVAAGILAAAEAATWVAARLQASGQGISTSAWTGTAALGAAVSDYGIVLVWVIGYAVLAMAVAMVVRSLAVALAVGILWAGPLEHLTQNAWTSAPKFFPGLLLEAIGQRGTPRVGMTQALVTAAAYTVVAAIVSVVVFTRRDVTTA